MATRNWNYDVTIDTITGQKCYETRRLVNLFRQLESDGYSGLSMGLIVDLIESRLPEHPGSDGRE